MPRISPDFNRLLKVLRRQGEPDRVPFYEHFADGEIVESITGKPITKMLDPDKPNVNSYMETLVEFYLKLGYDYVPLEVPLKLPRSNTLQTHDPAYLSRGTREWADEGRGTIETLEDFERYPWPSPEEAADLSLFEALARELPEGMGVVGGVAGGVFEHASWLMGLGRICRAVHLEKDLVDRMFRKVGSLILAVDQTIVKDRYVGVLRMGDDLGFNTGTFIPPRVLRQHAFPWYRKLAELAHDGSIPFLVHSCGDVYKPDETGKSVMDGLVDDVGIDAKHSYEDAIVPAWEVKRRYGGRLAVLGGVDLDRLIRLPENELRAYVRHVMRRCAPGGAWALGSGNSIANYVPVRNYLAMLDEGLKHGEYPTGRGL